MKNKKTYTDKEIAYLKISLFKNWFYSRVEQIGIIYLLGIITGLPILFILFQNNTILQLGLIFGIMMVMLVSFPLILEYLEDTIRHRIENLSRDMSPKNDTE